MNKALPRIEYWTQCMRLLHLPYKKEVLWVPRLKVSWFTFKHLCVISQIKYLNFCFHKFSKLILLKHFCFSQKKYTEYYPSDIILDTGLWGLIMHLLFCYCSTLPYLSFLLWKLLLKPIQSNSMVQNFTKYYMAAILIINTLECGVGTGNLPSPAIII
jgi:hypothetical protein